MSWPGEKQRHSMSSRSVRTSTKLQSRGREQMFIIKNLYRVGGKVIALSYDEAEKLRWELMKERDEYIESLEIVNQREYYDAQLEEINDRLKKIQKDTDPIPNVTFIEFEEHRQEEIVRLKKAQKDFNKLIKQVESVVPTTFPGGGNK